MRTRSLGWLAVVALAGAPVPRADAADPAWAALTATPSAVVLFRHADAPGTGDPAGFQLGDCTTQRNLGPAGRAQAKRLGERFRQQGVTVGRVLASQWCRTQETAELAFPGRVTEAPEFNSFFGQPGRRSPQTDQALATLKAWRGPGVLVVVTHQVNITALTGVMPASGEGVVVRGTAEGVAEVARLAP